MTQTKVWTSRGILKPQAGATKFHLTRHLPTTPALAFFVSRYWIIDWDLTEQEPYIQETLPYPCVNLVIEADESRIYGVETGKSTRIVQGKGRVFGIKFKPGGFYPFIQSSLARLTDQTLTLEEVFATDSRALEAAVLPLATEAQMIAQVESWLSPKLPEPDANVSLINQVVDCIIENRSITRVEDVAAQMALSKRSLQRLFSLYVGVSPKWVIKRYRLQDASEQLAQDAASGTPVDHAQMAQSLGYFDQAHYIKDFKALVGVTPAEYLRQLESPPEL